MISFLFNLKKIKKAINVNSTSVTSKVVVLDAGHGLPDEGAIGLYKTTEEAINLKITLKLQELLQKSGINVILTRSDENGIFDENANTIKEKKVSDIKNRVKIGNSEGVDIFVSIHLNKYSDSKYNGWQTFYQEKSEKSQTLAKFIQDGINNEISEIKNDRVPLKLNKIYIMDHVKVPTVTVECGFLSNDDEVKRLKDENYQERLAIGICKGIQNYFSNEEK